MVQKVIVLFNSSMGPGLILSLGHIQYTNLLVFNEIDKHYVNTSIDQTELDPNGRLNGSNGVV